MKKCSKCGIDKKEENFDQCKNVKSGLYPSCKECRKKYRINNREFLKEKNKNYYNKIKPQLMVGVFCYISFLWYICNMEKIHYSKIIDKHGEYASWAIWAPIGKKPTSNIGDLSVFDLNKNSKLLEMVNPNIVAFVFCSGERRHNRGYSR